MQRHEAESLGDILRRAIDESNATERLDEWEAVKSWPIVVGEELARKTSKPVMKNGRMTIGVPSAPLRHELNMMRSHFAAAINREVGKDIVKELEFRG